MSSNYNTVSASPLGRNVASTVTKVEKVLSNDYVVGVLTLLAIVYASRYAPKLPEKVSAVLNNIVARAIMFYIIAYCITRKAYVALVCTLVVIAVVLAAQLLVGDERMKNVAQQEYRQDVPSPVSQDGAIENEPLSNEWTQQQPEQVVGYSNTTDKFEEVVETPTEAVMETVSVDSTTVAPANQSLDKMTEGVSGVDDMGVEKFARL